jgi:Nif-specific regulatory protein
MPSLRERKDDIPLLANHFLSIFKQEKGTPELKISDTAMEKMLAYDWPGNVRELSNAVERAVVMGNDEEIRPEDLPISAMPSQNANMTVGMTLKEAVDRFKKE